MNRLVSAFRIFLSILLKNRIPDEDLLRLGLVKRAMAPQPPKPQAAASAADGAVGLLGLLQQEARLVDFLLEDIAPFTDEQVGAAVRDVHGNCRTALERHLNLEPVIDGVEGAVTKIPAEAGDAGQVKLLGNVPPGGKPESGILRHRGWKVDRIELPAAKPGRRIVAPAEIEVE